MFCLMASFNFNVSHFGSVAEAEQHYLEYHVPLARRLPGLRQYVIGRAVAFGGVPADRSRAAVLVFDDAEAVRAAYRSDVGRELRADEKRLIADAVLTFAEAQAIVSDDRGDSRRTQP